MNEMYKAKVDLLIKIMPLIAQEDSFAMHGGTAINLFVRDMPRLSVDIDLTYIPIEDRNTSLKKIDQTLLRIKQKIEKQLEDSKIYYKTDSGKLIIRHQQAEIKLEVNLVMRGLIAEKIELDLCKKAQEDFESYVRMPIVPLEQLYGGKICAALDRQHPRDLFDVKYILQTKEFSKNNRKGFLFCLLSSDRPIHEVLFPHFIDQTRAMENQFAGMTEEEFTYTEYEKVRKQLVAAITENLTDIDKSFLLNFKECKPDWSVYDFEKFPSIQWKLQNLIALKKNNPDKHNEQYNRLKEKLS